jgi:hypothetical protein
MAAPLRSLLLAMTLLASTSAAHAAVLCGRVTDGDTAAPVAAAGIFVRDTLGAYLGMSTATDLDGRYCFGDIAPGHYDLEVRRDDYATTYRRVLVTESTTDVDVALGPDGLAFAPPRPNPAVDRVELAWRQAGAGTATLRVVDAGGRLVRQFAGAFAAGPHRVMWDARDARGRAVRPGRYLASLRVGGETRTRSIVILGRP